VKKIVYMLNDILTNYFTDMNTYEPLYDNNTQPRRFL